MEISGGLKRHQNRTRRSVEFAGACRLLQAHDTDQSETKAQADGLPCGVNLPGLTHNGLNGRLVQAIS